MFKLEPNKHFIVTELVLNEKTEAGIILPDGAKASDTEDYKGETIVAVGDNVVGYSPGELIMVRGQAQPEAVKIKEDDGKVHTYLFFTVNDVVCKVK